MCRHTAIDQKCSTIGSLRINLSFIDLLVEQNAFMALSISSRCYVLENGAIIAHGDSKELSQSDSIRKAYLGG